jgi:hypothetical protein
MWAANQFCPRDFKAGKLAGRESEFCLGHSSTSSPLCAGLLTPHLRRPQTLGAYPALIALPASTPLFLGTNCANVHFTKMRHLADSRG